jgi:hypothetical protein
LLKGDRSVERTENLSRQAFHFVVEMFIQRGGLEQIVNTIAQRNQWNPYRHPIE